jgi:hypothetical protein
MLSPASIFRRIPGALPLSQRRLLGALAYASDSADLSFSRLKEIARAYHLPVESLGYKEAGWVLDYEDAGWVPSNRLSIITDAWACIDHLNRARKLVQRLPIADPPPPEVGSFLNQTRPAASIRNRIQHLDEDIFNGTNCVEGYPVLGLVSWADARSPGCQIRYSISSGPSIDSGRMADAQINDVDGAGDVVDFRLMAADHTVHLDEMMKALADFMSAFEVTVSRSIISGLRAAAAQRGVSLEEPRPHGIADMTTAMRMRPGAEGGWGFGSGDLFIKVEVPPGAFDISECEFRGKADSDSDGSRTVIPNDPGHP